MRRVHPGFTGLPGDRQRQTDRDRERQTDRDREKERERERIWEKAMIPNAAKNNK